MNLSDEEMQKLVHWINNGSVVEGNEDPLTALTWPDTKWTLGEPDLIVKVPPQTIPATGVVDYMDIPIDLGLTEDRWVRGSEVVPGAPLACFITSSRPLYPQRARQISANSDGNSSQIASRKIIGNSHEALCIDSRRRASGYRRDLP